MRPSRFAALTSLVLGAAVGACEAQQAPSTWVISSDPVLVELASEILPNLAERSGLELREPIRLERRSRSELVRYLQAKLDEEISSDEARATVDAYALFGLVPRDLDLRSMLLGLYTEQVAGYYEPDSTALFVMDDQSAETLEGLLVHELVHALQDQTADLDELTDRALGNDRSIAALTAIEGHATLVMLEYMTEQMLGSPIDLAETPDFAAQMRPALQAIRGQFPALAGAPLVIQESLLFPYIEGTSFVQALWTRGERLAPFGERLPESTEQVLARDVSDAPIDLALTASEGRIVRQDVLGRLEVGVLLREHGADPEAANGWEGDRWALVEADGERGLVWYALWEDAASRMRFENTLRAVLGELGAAATLEAVDVGGHPATLLRVGTVRGVVAGLRSPEAQ